MKSPTGAEQKAGGSMLHKITIFLTDLQVAELKQRLEEQNNWRRSQGGCHLQLITDDWQTWAGVELSTLLNESRAARRTPA
jgi:hypothetical protein